MRINGFLRQPQISSTNNSFLGDTDDRLNPEYREAVLIVTGPALPDVDLAAQLLSRQACNTLNSIPRIDYALLNWRIFGNSYLSHARN